MCCMWLAANTGRKKIAKNRHLGTIAQLRWAIIFATKAHIDNWKKMLSSSMSSTCPHNMVNFGRLTAEIGSGVWGTPDNFNGFASWQRYCPASTSGRQPNFTALNRGRYLHVCPAGPPSRWALAQILVRFMFHFNNFM